MKKKILFMCWILAPVFLLAFHYGPGQTGLTLDQIGERVAAAKVFEQSENWADAVTAYAEALALVPNDRVQLRDTLQLARAKARMYIGELPEAMQDMQTLLDETKERDADANLVEEIRGNLASAQYYAAWLMRLEGAPADEWTIPVDNARQHFRLLAESSESAGAGQKAERYQKNLEATIRLARMDLSELQGLPLPKCCKGCKNCSQKCRSQRQSKCKKPGKGEGEKKKKDARGAGFNDRPKGGS